MNDKLITKVIKKIHFKLLNFLVVFFLILFFGFVALVEGFTISHLKLGDIKFEGVYLKWDNRLHIKASLIDFSDLKSDDEPLNLEPLQHLPKIIKHAQQWIETIDIKTLRYKKTTVTLYYSRHVDGNISIHNDKITLDGHFTLTPETLDLHLTSLPSSYNHFNGRLLVNIPEQSFYFTTSLSLPKTPILHLYAHGDTEKLSLKINADRPFSQITTLVDFIGIDPIVRPWVVEYAKFQSGNLLQCEGRLFYEHPETLLESLNIHAKATLGEYKFDPAIAPIKAPDVDLYFQKGKLHIVPHNGKFYTLPTEKSRLFIDFTTPHTMLHAFIRSSQGQLNNDILFLLDHYRIQVPVRQNSGTADVDLNLSINLHDISIVAKGQFLPNPSEIELDGFLFNTTGGKVVLNDTNVVFSGFNTHYNHLASAIVQGSFNASDGIGKIQIDPYKCNPTNEPHNISLNTTENLPRIFYHINPNHDSIEISPSTWNFYGDTLTIGSLIIPFDFNTKHATLQKLPFSLSNTFSGFLNGEISPNDWLFSLHFDKVEKKSLLLLSPEFTLDITPKENNILISSPTPSSWEFAGEEFTLSPSSMLNTDKSLVFNNINILLKDQLRGTLKGEYQKNSQHGTLQLGQIVAVNPKISRYLNTSITQNFTIDASTENVSLQSKSLGIDLISNPLGWSMNIADISFLSKSSPLLTSYNIDKGDVTLEYSAATHRITFHGNVQYPYHLMMINGKSLSKYRFSGSFEKGKTLIRLNDRITISDDKYLQIRANNMGINGRELLRWLNDRQTSDTEASDTSTKPIQLTANNIYLYLMENRKILGDSLIATLDTKGLDGRLNYGNGTSDFIMKEGLFYVEGTNFNDHFMENLFALSDFDGGNLSFKISGKPNAFKGIMRIDDVTLKEYKVLNNVLSFVNTIPSLATFSLPSYSTKGLRVKDTYAHFTYNNHLFDIDTYALNSGELKIVGNAQANMIDDTLNGTLILKTDLGSALGKVPMVGYILLGDDGSISTTLNLTGKLSDPKVETGIAKEVVTAPFNILKRTVTYPFLWMIPDEKKK